MYLIAGLGNPGDKHAGQRHNVGFMAVDAIADEWSFGPWRAKHHGLMNEGNVGDHKVALLKPQTFMNNSGQSVAALAKFYKIDTNRIIIFYDELDLEPGRVRVKQGGGHGGHNGVKSLHAHLPDHDFWRVRIGIGHPGHKDKVTPYVLGDFSKSEKEWVGPLCDSLSRHVALLLDGDDAGYTNKIALDLK